MPTARTALVYPGMCLIEGTNSSEGRGTTSPFETVGFPGKNLTLEVVENLLREILHEEGRYRTFIDIERRKGAYPQAVWRRADGTERRVPEVLVSGHHGRVAEW